MDTSRIANSFATLTGRLRSGPFVQAGICLLAQMEFAGEVLICISNTMVHLPYRVFLAPVQPVSHHAALACAPSESCECCVSLWIVASRR